MTSKLRTFWEILLCALIDNIISILPGKLCTISTTSPHMLTSNSHLQAQQGAWASWAKSGSPQAAGSWKMSDLVLESQKVCRHGSTIAFHCRQNPHERLFQTPSRLFLQSSWSLRPLIQTFPCRDNTDYWSSVQRLVYERIRNHHQDLHTRTKISQFCRDDIVSIFSKYYHLLSYDVMLLLVSQTSLCRLVKVVI